MAHVDGALAFDGEEHHHLAVHIEHHHAQRALFVVSADGELALGRIGIDFSRKSRFGHFGVKASQNVFVVAVGNDLACHAQHGIVGGGTFGAGYAIDAVGMVGMAEVEIGRVELIE